MKNVLLTGATGFIGQNAIAPLIENGFNVFALKLPHENLAEKNVTWCDGDLFDFAKIRRVFAKVKPEYLLHFAWDTRPGIYLEDNANFEHLKAGLEMLKCFKENGGKRVIFAGTCFEYELGAEILYEHAPKNPQTTYGKCKNYLHQLAGLYAKNNALSFGWGRIFYVYGQNENVKRLAGYVVNSLKNKQTVTINSSQLVKDYMYTKEIARAFVDFLRSEVIGEVNICTGSGISLGDFCTKIAQKLGTESLLNLLQNPTTEPPIIVGGNQRLRDEIGFKPRYTLDEALDEIMR